jgi:hypothetical protein
MEINAIQELLPNYSQVINSEKRNSEMAKLMLDAGFL